MKKLFILFYILLCSTLFAQSDITSILDKVNAYADHFPATEEEAIQRLFKDGFIYFNYDYILYLDDIKISASTSSYNARVANPTVIFFFKLKSEQECLEVIRKTLSYFGHLYGPMLFSKTQYSNSEGSSYSVHINNIKIDIRYSNASSDRTLDSFGIFISKKRIAQ